MENKLLKIARRNRENALTYVANKDQSHAHKRPEPRSFRAGLTIFFARHRVVAATPHTSAQTDALPIFAETDRPAQRGVFTTLHDAPREVEPACPIPFPSHAQQAMRRRLEHMFASDLQFFNQRQLKA